MTIQANQGPGVSVFGATSAGGGGSTSPGGSSGQVQYNNGGSFGGMSGTSWDDTNRALTLTGATVTTSQPVLNLSQTWNNAATTFTGLLFNAAGSSGTNSASASLLLDLQVGGSKKFNVRKDGGIFFGDFAADASTPYITPYSYSGTNILSLGPRFAAITSNAYQYSAGFVDNRAYLFWNGNTGSSLAPDLYLSRANTATLQLGAADAAAPVAQTLQVQSVVAGTSNTAGTNWTLKGSAGTGNAAGGSIIFQVAPAGSSGTAQNTYATALTVNSSGFFQFNGGNVWLKNGDSNNLYIGNNGSGTSSQYGIAIRPLSGESGLRVSYGIALGQYSQDAYQDVFIIRDAANTLALRNSTNPQTFRVYNTYTDATINEYGTFDWSTSSNVLTIGAAKTGSGTVRSVKIVGGNNNNQSITLSNSNSIDLFAGGSTWMTVSPAGWINPVWTGGTPWTIGSQGDEAGNPNRAGSPIKIQPKGGSGNGAAAYLQLYTGLATTAGTTGHTSELCVQTFLPETGKPGLQFGGTTSSFPALKRSTTTLQVRLADDTGDADFSAAAVSANTSVNVFFSRLLLNSSGISIANGRYVAWGDGEQIGTLDTYLYRDASNTLAQRNGTNAQEQRVYASYTSGTNYQRTSIKTLRESSGALSGATYVSTIAIPAYAVLIGVTTRVTTAITGATTYDVGDGSDVDLWGAAIGVTAGSQSRTADFTAVAATGAAATSRTVTLTANGSNFTGGVVEICVHYMTTEAD